MNPFSPSTFRRSERLEEIGCSAFDASIPVVAPESTEVVIIKQGEDRCFTIVAADQAQSVLLFHARSFTRMI
ncbi:MULTISPECIES: hypothetical protein [unclassified Bradyrhizobium]|uniref:hypothetical protein n=1 Tax=unclassified Bradyrhizobium TaxID=2631580 RepID=UPI0028E36ECC|nr:MULTISPECIES: hypothetical protein [unclassified Bradyrhizobium]